MSQTSRIGMNDAVYFFDTYAFFEIIRGNPAYSKYVDTPAVTCIFNLAELNYNLKKSMEKKLADYYTDAYSSFLVEVTAEDIKKAMDMKSRKRHLSIPDAVGYTISRRLGLKFLTGDSDFKNIKNVEYVK